MHAAITQHTADSTGWYSSTLLATQPVTCVFTTKPVSYGGPASDPVANATARQALCQQLGLNPQALKVAGQTHSDRIAHAMAPDLAKTDALVIDQPAVPIALQFADCVPVVLYSPVQHIGVVVHAGWQGTAQSISRKAVQYLQQHYQTDPATLLAVVGPAIGMCGFQVHQPVRDALAITVRDGVIPNIYCQPDKTSSPEMPAFYVDVKQINALQLRQAGVQQIEVMPHCTHCLPDRLFSHRRGEMGRQMALLCLQ
jgi:polyphenol oxidase